MTDAELSANRELWDARARSHGTTENDRFYDVGSFLAGGQTLFRAERELVGEVIGRDLLHLHCHFGMDTLNWVRLGATATGVDFSPVAISRAQDLAVRAGLEARFIEADSQQLPTDLAGRFDVVVATYGVLCWIGDLDAWMCGAAMALRSGGRLVVVDLHPLFQTVATLTPLTADWPYGGGDPQYETVTGTYADAALPMPAMDVVQYPHSLGEIVTAAAGAGLVVDRLEEHLEAEFDPRGILPKGPDGHHWFPFSATHLPILYSMRASRTR
ncbi:class I SAM-dependent methyltransferase [Streptomyces sp. NPDC057271]|uniref:class I SAM-dependent methyltransferase n=1 Tax=unclassified Streptomyces TaxID=2593676 RepID=UPI00363B89ED